MNTVKNARAKAASAPSADCRRVLARDGLNDNAYFLNVRAALKAIASKLAPEK
jgi:hypothetical protein